MAELRWAPHLIGHRPPDLDLFEAYGEEAARLDRDGLAAFAERVRRELGLHDRHRLHLIAGATIDAAFDRHFPLPADAGLADVLDTPWPTAAREERLVALMPSPPEQSLDRRRRDVFVPHALASGDSRLLRLMATSRVGRLGPDGTVAMLDALHDRGELTPSIIEAALDVDRHLGRSLGPAGCRAAVHDVYDELTWRGVRDGLRLDALPSGLVPRGLRFVEAALTCTDPRLAAYLGAAAVPPDELVAFLTAQSPAVRRQVFTLRRAAGDAAVLLESLGLGPAAPLLAIIDAPRPEHPEPHDRAAILAADGPWSRPLLELAPSEPVSAALGLNRAAVEKRVRNNALDGIAAFGLLPLADGETALDRYLALQAVAKRGPGLGPNRRHSHAAAVRVAIAHLAQVVGADPARFEWECEARIATGMRTGWDVPPYRLVASADGIAVTKAGKALRSVPAAVRKDPSYAEARRTVDVLRDQSRRMRVSLIERLVATGGTLTPGEWALLSRLPSAAAMLPGLLWRDASGAVGLVPQVDPAGPLTAVHPADLLADGRLSHWQQELVRRRLRQPVKQVFRELYPLTPAERESGTASHRFAGHVVQGARAAALLSERGWRTHGEYADAQATRAAGPFVAELHAELHGYWGMADVTLRHISFQPVGGGPAVALEDVPPIVFSEVMRDVDLIVSVASGTPYHSAPVVESRVALVRSLVAALGLERVTVAERHARVAGSRATYVVHLGSGSIHLEPGGYLCVVPAGWGESPHERLFLPFADEDATTGVIISKILLLADDEHITDPSILAQIAARTAG